MKKCFAVPNVSGGCSLPNFSASSYALSNVLAQLYQITIIFGLFSCFGGLRVSPSPPPAAPAAPGERELVLRLRRGTGSSAADPKLQQPRPSNFSQQTMPSVQLLCAAKRGFRVFGTESHRLPGVTRLFRAGASSLQSSLLHQGLL